MYMDDIKLFARNKKELETLIQVARINSQNVGMEFGIEKCAMLTTLVYKNKFLAWGKNGDRCFFLLIWVCWIQIYK